MLQGYDHAEGRCAQRWFDQQQTVRQELQMRIEANTNERPRVQCGIEPTPLTV